MAFVPVPNTAKACLKWTIDNQLVCNTLWFEKSSGYTPATLNSLGTALNSWVVANMLPAQSHDALYQGCDVVDMSALGAPGVSVPLVPPQMGGSGVHAYPTNVTAAIKFLTGLTGRSFRGRNFFVGLADGQADHDVLLPSAVSSLKAIYDALPSFLVSLAVEHVVASLFSGVTSGGVPIPRTVGVTTPITGYALDPFLDSMRRRLIGRGR